VNPTGLFEPAQHEKRAEVTVAPAGTLTSNWK
jgi:hypothetical protein